MLTLALYIMAALVVIGFVIGMIFVGASAILSFVVIGFKVALVAVPLTLAYFLARALFGF